MDGDAVLPVVAAIVGSVVGFTLNWFADRSRRTWAIQDRDAAFRAERERRLAEQRHEQRQALADERRQAYLRFVRSVDALVAVKDRAAIAWTVASRPDPAWSADVAQRLVDERDSATADLLAARQDVSTIGFELEIVASGDVLGAAEALRDHVDDGMRAQMAMLDGSDPAGAAWMANTQAIEGARRALRLAIAQEQALD